MKSWKILQSTPVFQHQWYSLRQDRVQLPDGRILDDYFVSVRPDVVLILALTPDKQVPLVRQYKHGAQKSPRWNCPEALLKPGKRHKKRQRGNSWKKPGIRQRSFIV